MALTQFDSPGDEVLSEINMTPMVDIMLVLLIIFIVTVPVLNHAVNVQLPKAASQPEKMVPEKIEVSIDAAGALYWGAERIDEATLDRRLLAAAQQQAAPELHVRADEKVVYAHVARVMAASQRAGVTRLGFVTTP
jgi:biopolymer transport protein ExbD